jgi:hypothetical protein
MKLRILDTNNHTAFVDEYDLEIASESSLYVTFTNMTNLQEDELKHRINKGTYRTCGDDEYNFQTIDTTKKQTYSNFEDYYEQHKAEYLSGNAGDREFLRVHKGIHDLIKFSSKQLKCGNITATTTMLLQYGVNEMFGKISSEDLDTINDCYFKCAPSKLQYKNYDVGRVAEIVMARPIRTYVNSRQVILDSYDDYKTNKKVAFYQTDYVFKVIESLNCLGFDDRYTKFAYEMIICIGLSNSDIVHTTGIKAEIDKMWTPTIESIQEVLKDIKTGKI